MWKRKWVCIQPGKSLAGALSFFVIMNLRVDLRLKLYPAGAAERQLRVGVGQHEAALGEAVQGGGLQPPGAELVHILQHPDVGPGQPPIQYIYLSTSSSWPEVVSYNQDHIFLLCTFGGQWIKCQENEKKYRFHFYHIILTLHNYFNFPR